MTRIEGPDYQIELGSGHYPYGRFIVPGSLFACFYRFGLVVGIAVEMVDGRPVVTDLVIRRGADGLNAPGLTGTDLRKVTVDKLVREALLIASHRIEAQEGTVITTRRASAEDDAELGALTRKRGKRARRTLDDDFLSDVSDVYREAEVEGSPVWAVAEHWSKITGKRVPRATASRWVAAARDRGLLPGGSGPVEGCEESGCGRLSRHAHHITAIAGPIDEFDEGSLGGGSITQTFCARHCPGGCDKEHK